VDKIYDKYDKENSGVLGPEDAHKLMSDVFEKMGKGKAPSDQHIRFFIRSMDQNGDGLIEKS
jgi:hypothetical protein